MPGMHAQLAGRKAEQACQQRWCSGLRPTIPCVSAERAAHEARVSGLPAVQRQDPAAEGPGKCLHLVCVGGVVLVAQSGREGMRLVAWGECPTKLEHAQLCTRHSSCERSDPWPLGLLQGAGVHSFTAQAFPSRPSQLEQVMRLLGFIAGAQAHLLLSYQVLYSLRMT